MTSPDDPRRRIPRTDTLLALPEVRAAAAGLGEQVLRGVIHATQQRARRGEIAPEQVAAEVVASIASTRPVSLRPVLNATGVIVHTNLGRAPLSAAATTAIVEAAGYCDLELDLATGTRSRRGVGARAALLAACPAAEDALIVNNAAAALMLATTALAGTGATDEKGVGAKEIVLSRGEFIEIGAGFRISDLIAATGARIREIGTTNRTHLADYDEAVTTETGCVLKIHPSNYYVAGFTSSVETSPLAELCRERGVPLIADIGSGLLAPEPRLPNEPDATTALGEGADLVIASGDKLLGGPQAGIILGRRDLIGRIARHPIARAVRADKLTLAAVEATVAAGTSPVREALGADADQLRQRTEQLASRATAATDIEIAIVPHDGRVGGGGGVGVPLPGWALALPEAAATPLRTGTPAVLPRSHDGACLIDLRCIPADRDAELADAIIAALRALR
ncbi:L-seryl-tRNA(Sec) selenium transferase [Gulosibacter sp. GYB002]|uniref:L-seryl-tRNA(Sec) selenium transferase n=1 Tax=Gulosibacter sp. GYB002 TaxID=2994391 RepID=UPI002F96E838